MTKYRKKPVEIEAVKWTGNNIIEMTALASRATGTSMTITDVKASSQQHLLITTLEGDLVCKVGDWMIKGVEGELYPVRNDIFIKTYEQVYA